MNNLQPLLDKLNKHFGKHATLTYIKADQFEAYGFCDSRNLYIEGQENALHPEVLAHEFAHLLVPPTVVERWKAYLGDLEATHPKAFFKAHRKVCKVLNIKPTLTSIEKCCEFGDKLDEEVNNATM